MSLKQTETEPPIKFDWSLSGPDGARFILYPVRGQHTDQDVKKATAYLHHNSKKNVVSLQVRWTGEDPGKMPDKIPDELLIKELLKQIGQKESYIEELEARLKAESTTASRQLKKDTKKEVQREDLYKKLNEKLKSLEKENLNFRQTISDLIVKLNSKK